MFLKLYQNCKKQADWWFNCCIITGKHTPGGGQVNSPVCPSADSPGSRWTSWSPPSGPHLTASLRAAAAAAAAVRTGAGSGPPSGSGRRDTPPPRAAAAGRSRTGGGAASRRPAGGVRPGGTAWGGRLHFIIFIRGKEGGLYVSRIYNWIHMSKIKC